MAISTLRKNDEKCSNIISDFLDTNFYKDTTNFLRNDEFNEQILGIDTKFTYHDYDFICDEKAAIQYINKPLNTFALELSFFNRRDEESIGWFLNKKNINNSYLFCWIDKAITSKLETIDDILDIEIALVKKDEIVKYLSKLGWDYDSLLSKCKNIRNNDDEYLGNIYKNNCKFVKSFQLVEKPINILLKRETLIDLSEITIHYNNEASN